MSDGFFAEIIRGFGDQGIPADFFSAYATSAYLGIIESWLNNEMAQSPEEMALIYVRIKLFGMKGYRSPPNN